MVNYSKFWILISIGTLIIMISLVFLPFMVPKNPDLPTGINGYIWMWGFWIDIRGEYMGMLLNVSIYGIIFSIIIIVFAIKNVKLLVEFRKTQNFTKKMNKNSLLLAILTLVLTVLWLIFFMIIPLGSTSLYDYHVIGYGFVINLIGGGLVLISAILMNKIVRE
ncbi:unnamed protein product [marine sediment metagenome]|uniref:Uncharacterized protein n=1 Tax=marine sediment metagenome TaxID=412755 RepID=X1USM8_9ZZZZ